MNYIILFLEGLITFISPCILPMIPIYISYFMGQNSSDKKKSIINSIAFVLGFAVVFTALGALASSLGLVFNNHITIINIVSGILMIIFGLNYIGILKLGFLQRTYKLNTALSSNKFTVVSSILFGMVFGVGWTPCVGPFLGSALMIATNSNHMLEGILMLLSYSLGLGVPFILSAILIDTLKGTFDFIKRNYKTINIISGLFLIIVGVMMMTGYLNVLLSLLTF